jgi:hypothetical protein
MSAASELVPAIAAITNQPLSKLTGIRRRLTETGLLPSRQGAYVPDLNPRHAALIVLALLADVEAKNASQAALSYYELRDEHGNKFGDVISKMIASFRLPSLTAALAYKSRIEIDCGRTRATISSETTEGQFETLFGVKTPQWSDHAVKRSMTISGKCLFDIAMALR